MMKIVRRLCDELGKTVILVLHEINYAAFYSDYICAFKDGRIAKFGTVEEVMTKETLSQIYQVDFEIMEIEGRPCPSTIDPAAQTTANIRLEMENTHEKESLALALALALGLTACSTGGDDTRSTGSPSPPWRALRPAPRLPPPRNRHHHPLNADKEAVELEVPTILSASPFWTWPPWIFWMPWAWPGAALSAPPTPPGLPPELCDR